MEEQYVALITHCVSDERACGELSYIVFAFIISVSDVVRCTDWWATFV